MRTLLAAALAQLAWLAPAAHAASLAREPIAGIVVGVLDGETLAVRIGDRLETVRYIGIRTPVIRHPATGPAPSRRLAAAAHAELVEGRVVTLEPGRVERDTAGRLLAFVMLDGRLVNAELVRRGFAEVVTIPPNTGHRREMLALQAQAQARRVGLWADPDALRFYRPTPSGVVASPRTTSFFHVDDDTAMFEERREYFETPEAAMEAGYTPSFDYGINQERESRARLGALPRETGPSHTTVLLAPPAPAPTGHLWRGGRFVPVPLP